MTGRDLIMYILKNGLEDEQVFKDGRLLGFISVTETACKFDVGESTVHVWVSMNMIPHVKLGDTVFIPGDVKDPRYSKGVEKH